MILTREGRILLTYKRNRKQRGEDDDEANLEEPKLGYNKSKKRKHSEYLSSQTTNNGTDSPDEVPLGRRKKSSKRIEDVNHEDESGSSISEEDEIIRGHRTKKRKNASDT